MAITVFLAESLETGGAKVCVDAEVPARSVEDTTTPEVGSSQASEEQSHVTSLMTILTRV